MTAGIIERAAAAVGVPKAQEPAAPKDDFQFHLHTVLDKLKNNPTSITPDDARRLHEHFDAMDEKSARVISAIETLAAAHDDIAREKGNGESLGQAGHASLHTLVQDLHFAVDKNPEDVTAEILKLTQSVVSKMQKATGGTVPHPELESQLQEEFAKIEPKVEQGTVTKEEADRLHSLEARAHGHTEKGGLTATAQSVAAKRERQLSISEVSGSDGTSNSQGTQKDREGNLRKVEFVLRPKIQQDPDHVTKEDASLLVSNERRAHGVIEKGSVAATAQSLADKNANLQHLKDALVDKEPEQVTKEDAATLQSREARVHGDVEQGGMAANIQSLADANENKVAVSAK